MKIVLLICFLVFTASASNFVIVKPLPSLAVDTSFLKNAPHTKRYSFGQLQALIEQARQFKEVSQVQSFLDGLLKDINDAREQKFEIITNVRAQCAEEEEFRKEAVTEGQRSAVASQNQLTLCSSQRDQAVHLRDLANSALILYQQELVDLADARDYQHRVYVQRSDKLKELQASIVQVTRLLEDFEIEANKVVDSTTLIQKTNKLFEHSIRTGHSQFIVPVYSRLLEMHSKQAYDPSDVDQVNALLDQLSENAANALQALDDQEASDLAAYEASVDRITAIINRLTNQVVFTSTFITTMEQCINQETSLLELSNDKVTRNSDLLDQAQKLCDASEEEWRLYEISRTRQVNIVNALKDAVVKIEGDYEVEILAKYQNSVPN